jgi:hypothetical protein
MPTPSDDASLTLSPTWFAAIFGTIWKNAVRRRYEMGVINSERALQACIVEALSPLAPEIVALVEPRVVIGSGNLKPDLWIGNINSKRALAIVEIKYVPHDYPKLGIACDLDTIGIYAVIGKHDADAICSEILKERKDVQALAKHRVLHAWGSVPHDSATKLDFGTCWIAGGESQALPPR